MQNNKILPILGNNLNFKNITHGFFTKNGGFSSENNYSLNCSYNSNDLKTNVYNNRKLVCNYHKLYIQNLKIVNQVHSNKVVVVNNLKDITSKIDADAIITNKPNIILGILTADCAPVLACDPLNNIIAAIHIGWKGAIKNILSCTIDSFVSMKSDAKNIRLAIGPCIGPESYNVKKDFYNKFTKNNVKNKKYFINIFSNKYKFNLPQYIKDQALEKGVIEKNISNTNKDTFIEDNNFFSYRRNYKKNLKDCGRMISTISIKIK